MVLETEDTIAAIATPYGRAALGTIRISGPETVSIASKIFFQKNGSAFTPHRPILGRIVARDREIDEALVTYFQKPHSYTKEDLIEITCHGNPLILDMVLDSLLTAGARLARPGEFTYRAFLNGRLDLVQASAVQDLVTADSIYQAELALQHMGGKLSGHLQKLRTRFIELISLLEGNIDFSEEQHYNFIDHKQAKERLASISEQIRQLLGTFERGRLIRDGFHVAIVGKPNVGKSSIFNSLLGESRAIVTPLAGTTRDYLRERLTIGNFLVHLTDTAGVHEGAEEIEKEGIQRSLQVIENADLVLFVVDGSEPLTAEDFRLWKEIQGKQSVVLINKTDLPERETQNWPGEHQVRVSAVTRTGMAELLDFIRQNMEERIRYGTEDFLISNLRHRDCLMSALDSLNRAADSLNAGMSEEFAMVDLHQAQQKIGEITGEVTVEDIYRHIFTNFCIGK
jgi:tRNA modification GTPase